MADSVDLEVQREVSLGEPIEQLRAVPLRRTADDADSLLLVHSPDRDQQPAPPYMTFPEEPQRLTLLGPGGERQWTTELSPGILPGIWFVPVFPFDLDGDGTEEIWCVTSEDPDRPLYTSAHRLARIDPATGEVTGTWEWPRYPEGRLSLKFRNFILGGHVGDDPVLVTAQGTYADMYLQGWNPDMSRRWEIEIDAWDPEFFEVFGTGRNWRVDTGQDAPGARGSHRCPVLDIDGDGADELLWGERLIDLDTGEERWCADRDTWYGHSDIVFPTYDHGTGEWTVYTCRESYTDVPPRVAMYDDEGQRVWGAIEDGHIDKGWTARVDAAGDRLATAGRVDDGDWECLAWEAASGEPVDVAYEFYATRPIDLDGDGVHEFVGRRGDVDGEIVDIEGAVQGEFDGTVAGCQPSKLLDRPGEQFVTYTGDGVVRVLGDRNARDSEAARERYEHPYYRKAQRLSAVGYNVTNVAGL